MNTFAGLSLDRPRIMGIINVTPDSFSDGGEAFALDDAVTKGMRMVEDGADIIDVGGESTRPGAVPVDLEEEIRRTVPVVERLVEAGALVSIDTRHGAVMRAAVDVGAHIINDVSALTGKGSLEVVAGNDAALILMHMQGEPGKMQTNPTYADAPGEVLAYLQERVSACAAVGINRARIALDPGIGFGKTLDHNLEILKHLSAYNDLGLPLVLGVSRKSFLGKIAGEPDVRRRLGGSLAAALWGVAHGARLIRVHDVRATAQAFKVWAAIEKA